jgi:hypothetical protein
MTGVANYKGDLQQSELTMKNAKQVFTFGATYNIVPKLALRAEISSAKLQGNDADNTDPSLSQRNLNFKSNLVEMSLMGEYDFLNLANYKLTPYIFAGVGNYSFNPYTSDSLNNKVYLQPLGTEGQGLAQYPDKQAYKLSQLNIPFGVGIKYALSDFVYVGAEFGTRKLFSDYLDDVSTTYADENALRAGRGQETVNLAFRGDELKNNPTAYPAEGTIRGNPNSNDNYYFGQVRLSIRLPWFETGTGDERKKQYMCPRF